MKLLQVTAPEGSGWILFFTFLIGGLVYFLPTIIANRRKKRDTTSIVLINTFLGWTVVGWVVALVWATSSEKKIVDREKMIELQEEQNRLLREMVKNKEE